jgi:hypothetical protein
MDLTFEFGRLVRRELVKVSKSLRQGDLELMANI